MLNWICNFLIHMKRLVIFLISCIYLCGCDAKYTEFWSEASYATIDAITGTYSLYSGTWSSEIDLSGEGFVTDDILYQLVIYGWTGIQSIRGQEDPESISVLHQSLVIYPERPEYMTQINLYVPYPEYGKDKTDVTIEMAGRCNISMDAYQFHYKVNSKGDIEMFNIDDRQMSGHGGKLKNVDIRFEGNYIHFKADTSFYDWETSSWQDGTMNLTYIHN